MPSNQKLLQTLLHISFFLSGITTVLIGQALPILAEKFSLNDKQLAFFFPTQFAGSIFGTFFTNWFGKQNKFLIATIIGCFAMACGILLLSFNSYSLCFVGFFINGIGIGLTLPSINMLILELNQHRTISALNILNFFWGLGAIICSLSVLNLAKSHGLFSINLVLAVLLIITIVIIIVTSEFNEEKHLAIGESSNDFSVPIWTTLTAWLIAIFNFIHVGFESAIGGWLPTYTVRFKEDGQIWWLFPTFLYFLFFVVGRGIAPLFASVFNETKLIFLGLSLILIGILLLLYAENVSLLRVGATIAGFGTSWVFPTNLSRFNKTFGTSASRRMMPFFIMGTIGAASTNWLVGYISNQFEDNLRIGMFVLLASIILLTLLQIILTIKKAK
jgi:fucose permease